MSGVIILGAIVLLVIDYFVANSFQSVANEKGFESKLYFWLTFLLGIVGMLLVIALPDRGNTVERTMTQAVDELPDL